MAILTLSLHLVNHAINEANESPEEKVYRFQGKAWETIFRSNISERAKFFLFHTTHKLFQDVGTEIFNMQGVGKPKYAINLAIDGLIEKYHNWENRFIKANDQYEKEKSDLIKTHRIFQEKVDQLNFDFSPIEYDSDDIDSFKKRIPLELAKEEVGRCVQPLTPLSRITSEVVMPLGVEICLALSSQDLDQEQKKELRDFVPEAIIGKHVNKFNEIFDSFVARSEATKLVVKKLEEDCKK